VRDADGVHLFRDTVVHVRDKISVSLLLEVEIIHVDPMGSQVRIELRLLRQLSLTNLLAPEGVLPQVFPVDALHGVLLQAASQQVVKHGRKALNLGRLLLANLLNQIF